MNTISSRYYTVDYNYRGEKIAPYTVDVQKLIEDDIKADTRANTDTLTLSGNYILYSTQGNDSITEATAPSKDSQDDFSYYDYFKNIDHFDNKHSLLRTTALKHDNLLERKQEYTDRFAL